MPFRRPVSYFANRFHDKQEEAWLGYYAGLDLVLDHGRRSGKSELVSEIFIEDIETHGRDCLYIALTQDQARDIMWGKFEQRLDGRRGWRSNASRLEWRHIASGAKISLKGSDIGKHRLRGGAKRLIALDEFAFFKDHSMVKDVLIPMIADFNGQMIYTSTPKGKNHFYHLKQKAIANPQRYFTNHATVFDNPFVSEEGRNKLLEEYTGIDDPLYRQEVLGEYIDYQGLVFALPVNTYTEERWWHADLEHSFVWRGLDHGYSPDPTACVWVAYNKRKGYYQCFSEYERAELLIANHSSAINSLEPFKVLDTYADHDTQCNAEYKAVGLDVSNAIKHDRESKLLYLVNQLRIGRLKISKNCTQLLKQMSTYEWDQDGDDHLIDALRYAITSIVLPQDQIFEDIPQYKTKSYDGYSQDFGD